MINVTVLMGRICHDLELKKTTSDLSVTSFNIAVDRQGKKDTTDFISIVAWRQTADFICKHFTKGKMIAIDGSIQTRSYEDKNGNKRIVFEVVANNVSFAGDKPIGKDASRTEPAYAEPIQDEDSNPEDLPF